MMHPMTNLDLTNTVQTEYRSFAERHRYASAAAPKMGKEMQIACLETSRKSVGKERIRISRPTTRFFQLLRALRLSSETAPGSSS